MLDGYSQDECAGRSCFHCGSGEAAKRKATIDRHHDLPLNRQAQVLGISRGSVYYLPRAVPAADLTLMRAIDTLHLE